MDKPSSTNSGTSQSVSVLFQTAMEHHKNGRITEAEELYHKVLDQDPGHADSHHLLGVIAFEQKDYLQAETKILKALSLCPGLPLFHCNLGLVYEGMENYARALEQYIKVINQDSGHYEALYRAGLCCQAMDDVDGAVGYYEKSLSLKPDQPEIWSNLGNIAVNLYRIEDAELYYMRAIALNGRFAEAHNNLGVLYAKINLDNKAIDCFLKALHIIPDFYEAMNNLAKSYKKTGRMEEAIELYNRALAIHSDLEESLYGLADALISIKDEERAVTVLKHLITVNPDHGHACQRLYSISASRCDWDARKRYGNELTRLTSRALEQGEVTPESPFAALGRYEDINRINSITRSWSLSLEHLASGIGLSFPFKRGPKEKIILGYYSNNVKNHANAHLVSGLFERHDRNRFQVFCFSYGEDDGSEFRKRIERGCDRFIDMYGMGYIEAARMIFESGVDILIDLTGYTLGSCMEVCALRPAPVQVRFLGFPSSICAEFFDYIVTDKILTPPDIQKHYTEKFIYMPDCYQINEPCSEPEGPMMTKESQGLPETGFVFCSFNTAYKLEPVMFGIWMEILKQVPGSVLWLLKSHDGMADHLVAQAEKAGIDASRLVFADKMPKDQHLGRLKLADLVLDTRLVGGHLSTSDALRAGVPVLTLQGNHFISRASSTILAHMGLPELVTTRLDEYEALAVRLATHPDELAGIRKKLAENRMTSPVFDTGRFVRHFEKGLAGIWDRYIGGKQPEQIEIERL